MTRGLLIIDIQNDYFPGGKMELEGSEAASLRAGELLAAFRDKRLPVVHLQHLSVRPGASFFLPDTDGVRIHANVAPAPGETVLQKNFPNGFRETALLEQLRKAGIQDLVIARMMTPRPARRPTSGSGAPSRTTPVPRAPCRSATPRSRPTTCTARSCRRSTGRTPRSSRPRTSPARCKRTRRGLTLPRAGAR